MHVTESSGVWPFGRRYLWLVLLTLLVALFQGMYIYRGVPFSPLAEFIATYTIPLAIMIWVVWDAQSRRCTPCYDFGLMVYLGWMLAIPGYLVWTRGWKGIFILLGFALLFLMPWISASILWQWRWGS